MKSITIITEAWQCSLFWASWNHATRSTDTNRPSISAKCMSSGTTLSFTLFTKTCTGCGRNSELIINKNNILLKIIDTNFTTSQFTMVLNFFLQFHFLCTMSFRWPPPSSMQRCMRVKKLRITAWSVSSESLTISSRMFSLSVCKSVGRLLYNLLFK